MAISPPGDIIMDVARAADPAAVEAAKARLQSHAGRATVAATFDAGTPNAGLIARTASSKGDTPEAYVKFESMVLQTFLKSMLPENTENVYGPGISGEMWKSLLAQQLGDQMARRGGIGIADRVLGDYYLEGDKKVPVSGVSSGPGKEQADTQNLLSSALLHEIQRKAAQSLSDDTAIAAGDRNGV